MSTIAQFRTLHEQGSFVLPNPWDPGSARLLEGLGFHALATTSSGFALSRGTTDGNIELVELLAHVRELCAATDLPVNVDGERLFAPTAAGLGDVVEAFVDAGAAGLSIEDYNGEVDAIDPLPVAVERLGRTVEAASESGVVITARAENLIRGVYDFEDTIERLRAYRDAGADVLYAPGLVEPAQIVRVVELGPPINVLVRPDGPSAHELAELGVRRVSVGGALARAAYATMVAEAVKLGGRRPAGLQQGSLDSLLR